MSRLVRYLLKIIKLGNRKSNLVTLQNDKVIRRHYCFLLPSKWRPLFVQVSYQGDLEPSLREKYGLLKLVD